MKTLKFKDHLVPKILGGSKTVTWRLFDDKDLSVGDRLEFINSDTGEKFAEVEITHVREKELGKIDDSDFEGHEKYDSQEDMLDHYKKLYGDRVNLDTIVKIINFKLI